MINLESYLKSKQQKVEEALRETVRSSTEGCPNVLLEAMEYSLLAPGKRLRPILVLMAAEACGGTDRIALPAACAVEMIHTYSLIHDDLPAMDDDDLRRGLPTCHKKFSEALAILAGDALLTLAFQLLADRYPARTSAVSCKELAIGAGAGGMVGGQVLDLASENRLTLTQEPLIENRTIQSLENIHRRKTGALFRASLRLGYFAIFGEETNNPLYEKLERLDTFGRAFGLCFQITDDLLDVEGNTSNTGKRVGKDASRGKLTYPGLLGIEESRKRAIGLYQEAIRAIEPLGVNAQPLMELARFVIERDR
jgi:geranylgeranyl diphosphate synthase, type II